jgi:trehalose/maltose hydrolase-like predicted phosphorylase
MSFRITTHTPEIATADPAWSVTWNDFEPLRERELESLMTVGNGYLGTRGSVEEGSSASRPLTLIAGVYDALPEAHNLPELVAAPNWLSFKVLVDGKELSLDSGENLEHIRTLDIKRGVLYREWRHRDSEGRVTRYRSVRFASMADRHVLGMRIWISPENYSGNITVESGIDGDVANIDFSSGTRRLKYLDSIYSNAIESGGVLFAMRTKGHRANLPQITVALASQTLVSCEDKSAGPISSNNNAAPAYSDGNGPHPIDPQHRSTTNQVSAVEITEWEALEGKSYVVDKFVSVWTSRDNIADNLVSPATADGHQSTAAGAAAVARRTQGDGHDGSNPETFAAAARLQTATINRALYHLRQQTAAGLDSLMSESAAAWRSRWADAEIGIEKRSEVQHELRFAMYHLIIAANPEDDRISISARTLSGQVYNGHIFWDTEIFMLPFFTYTHPPSARALLMYRYWTLPGACEKARSHGYQGAMYAWESADTGLETTPTEVPLPTGGVAKVLSGIEEDHISADVPYAVWQYWNATGDDRFVVDFGAEIIIECARFWASRVTEGKDGNYHILKVIGPDEYHEDVADDAFTNRMAGWTMETAAAIAGWIAQNHPEAMQVLKSRIALSEQEPRRWLDIAAKMYIAQDPDSGLIEQCAGFFRLEQIDLASFEPRTAPIDMLLGHDRVQRAQVIKQADVLMLFQLLPDRYPRSIVRKNYDYYEPRTGHGSSLSPATHALIAARLGLKGPATHFFDMAANIDLGNGMGNASGGIHAATCGGLWQAFVFGFAGIEPLQAGIAIDPRLPEEWGPIAIPMVYRGRHLWIAIDPEPLRVRVSFRQDGDPIEVRIGAVLGTVANKSPLSASFLDGAWRLNPADG